MERDILDYASKMHCQELHMAVDEATGLKAIIAIHDTTLGPALGGCRCIEYPSTDAAAIDAIRLAQGMTYKAALANLPLGGGKMVVLKPHHIKDRVSFFKAVGRFVDSFQGRYITAEDSGVSVSDMDIISTVTPHVMGTSHGAFSVMDPSIMTARGVERGIQAAVKFKLGRDTLKGLRVALQGLGHVGYDLMKRLHKAGAIITVYEINPAILERAVKECQVHVAPSTDALLQMDCDVFAPCALGGILNDETLLKLRTSIVAGAANNQLEEERHGEILRQEDILYVPDYVINAGGLIYVSGQVSRMTEDMAIQSIDNIYNTLLEIFERSEREQRSTNAIADAIAVGKLKEKGLVEAA